MKKSQHFNGNGKLRKTFNQLDNTEQQVVFPVSYHLKAIFLLPERKEFYINEMNVLFVSLDINNRLITEKISKKGNYISFTYWVHLESKTQMLKMYDTMKKIEGLKFAL